MEQKDGRQAGRGKGEIMIWAEKERARAEEWQHVCTAEHKLKKPRSPSHTPLGPNSTECCTQHINSLLEKLQDVWERQGDAS